jgi:hypothetical protein
LFQSAKRIVRSVWTSGLLKIRASSITIAVPEPSSLAASPQPMPSMWAPMMYISPGVFEPTLVQKTSSRGPSVAGCELRARSFSSGCAAGSLFTPVRAAVPKIVLPPCPGRLLPAGWVPRPRPPR